MTGSAGTTATARARAAFLRACELDVAVRKPGNVSDASPGHGMHAALFRKPFVTALPVRNLGERVDLALQNMQLLQPILDAACDDTLTASHFAALLRARRNYGPYLKTVLALSENSGRTHHAIMTCRSVVKRLNAPRFRRRLAELMQEQHNYSSSGPIISNP